jgi:hypothetical protein
MTEQPKMKTVKKDELVHPDLVRLAQSMRKVLLRKYPNTEQRQAIASQIMQKVVASY